jgi:hypothetical protein
MSLASSKKHLDLFRRQNHYQTRHPFAASSQARFLQARRNQILHRFNGFFRCPQPPGVSSDSSLLPSFGLVRAVARVSILQLYARLRPMTRPRAGEKNSETRTMQGP